MATTSDRAAHGIPDTWSRSELLRARGYDETVIAGTNGHAPTEGPPAFEAEATNGADAPMPERAPVGRTCRGCGASLEGRATVWCGQRCKRRFYENRRRRAPKASTAPRPAPALPQAADSPAAALEPPWAVLADLADQLPAGWRLELAAGRAVFAWSKEN